MILYRYTADCSGMKLKDKDMDKDSCNKFYSRRGVVPDISIIKREEIALEEFGRELTKAERIEWLERGKNATYNELGLKMESDNYSFFDGPPYRVNERIYTSDENRLKKGGRTMSKEIAHDHSVLKEDLKRARANVMNRGKDAFIAYNVSVDCINPLTEEPLFSQSDVPIVRFLADAKNEIDYDAASSLEANIIYEDVFASVTNVMDKKAIRDQYDDPRHNRYGLKYELGEPNCTGGLSYRGDVMNSAEITNKVYYWDHKELHRNVTGKEFPWPKEALEFFEVYHTPRNFMIHPWRDGFDIDKARKDARTKDYFDLFLLGIYNYFLEQDGKQPLNNCSLYNVLGGHEDLCLFMRYYLMPFIEKDRMHYSDTPRQFTDDIEDGSDLIMYVVPGWESFVTRHLLHDFVERGHYDHFAEPKELWNGHFENYNNTLEYPLKEQQFIEFWTNATDMIRKRSARIYDLLHHEQGRVASMTGIRF